jgi:hypothetical protein
VERSISVRPYNANTGFLIDPVPGVDVRVRVTGSDVSLSANRAGLIWLAQALVSLAEDDVPAGTHAHLEPGLDLADGSASLALDRIG